jgi:hypothetical protein
MPHRSGIDHHNAEFDFELVERCRTMHEDGRTPTKIRHDLWAEGIDVSMNTLNDWLYYRTRINS